jgi:ribosomal protein S18 acetylase RimI-like enzyme
MITLRDAREQDEGFWLSVFEAVRAETWVHLPGSETQKSALTEMQFRAQRTHYQAAFPNASYQIILLDESPVGTLTLTEDDGSVHLVDIAVLPERQNQGIGSGLIRRLMMGAAEKGKPLNLHVEQSNPARRLYERLGFEIVEEDAMYVAMTWAG